ncbi:hypothetical protein BC827DRAFT_1263905 [Russula dissimulans]|nr:hypothetical protein BC827DRAFT_1263905 [Russula dissimulans]
MDRDMSASDPDRGPLPEGCIPHYDKQRHVWYYVSDHPLGPLNPPSDHTTNPSGGGGGGGGAGGTPSRGRQNNGIMAMGGGLLGGGLSLAGSIVGLVAGTLHEGGEIVRNTLGFDDGHVTRVGDSSPQQDQPPPSASGNSPTPSRGRRNNGIIAMGGGLLGGGLSLGGSIVDLVADTLHKGGETVRDTLGFDDGHDDDAYRGRRH